MFVIHRPARRSDKRIAMAGGAALLRYFNGAFIALDAQDWRAAGLATRVDRVAIGGVGFGPEMSEHMVAAAALALGPQRRQVDWAENDLLTGPRVGLGQNAAIVVHEHAAAGPGERRIMLRPRPLVGRHHVGQVFQRPAAVDYRPPIQRWRRAPRVHVSRYANQHLRSS